MVIAFFGIIQKTSDTKRTRILKCNYKRILNKISQYTIQRVNYALGYLILEIFEI